MTGPFSGAPRRTGPDLNRVGGKYPDSWHYKHLDSPQSMFEKSNMPPYGWLAKNRLDTSYSFKKTSTLGYGYSESDVRQQIDQYRLTVTDKSYASKESRDKITPPELGKQLTEMDALIAYLQKLGRDVKKMEATK